jgi:cellobiose phosphorylase
MKYIEFQDNNGTFKIQNPENYSSLYLPMAGEKGIKSSIAPNLGGDCKKDQNHFLLEPVSVENLHNNRSTRNFWCRVEGKGCWSLSGASAEQESQKFTNEQDRTVLEAGFMWQKLKRTSEKYGLEAVITSFVPVNDSVEVMMAEITNTSEETQSLVPIAAVPIYGRSADNIRDHRHVTSLLHRIHTTEYGVVVKPVLSFDERGHQKNQTSYYVCGSMGDGAKPEAFYPTVEEFIGEGGTFLIPEAVRKEIKGRPAGSKLQGKEAMGGICFPKIELKSQETAVYIVLAGIAEADENIEELTEMYRVKTQADQAFEEVKQHWTEKVNVSFETQNKETDNYLRWICFQPILRRIFGCSFLPYHDYGKGGRGWRDLWQDCLALLIMEPSVVRQMIIDNYGGVRIDGTNATIIGSGQGEFIADRNNITRVWMDHAFWPFVTTKLYIDQTGDIDILLEKAPYFKDRQSMRGTDHDTEWTEGQGNRQRTKEGQVYFGNILEHILLQNLCAFYDVGEHNQMRLHGADWNDALDMAWERGESVAFTCAYAGNLRDIGEYLDKLEAHTGCKEIELAGEIAGLLSGDAKIYESMEEKQKILTDYISRCQHAVSGNTIWVKLEELHRSLKDKADWLMEHIRKNEWIEDSYGNGWFNGYYDNHGNKAESGEEGQVRMMLTGQVFSIMSGTASDEQIHSICQSADRYLYEKEAGGYRLNTDFHEEKFDLGRMFGFAYGEKENGAVFSHMTVMYANALYKRGYVEAGHKTLKTLLEAAMNFENSKMYPGIPEYFDNQGKGLYSYLTGAASWYMLTMVTEVYGVKGDMGDLIIMPKLMADEFDDAGNAAVNLEFSGKKFRIIFSNPQKKSYGQYKIEKAVCNEAEMNFEIETRACLEKEEIAKLDSKKLHTIQIYLV